MYGKKHSLITIENIRNALKSHWANKSHPKLGFKGPLSYQYGIGGKIVYIYNAKTKELKHNYPSINATIKQFHISNKTLINSIKNNLLIKSEFIASFHHLKADDIKFNNISKTPNQLKVSGTTVFIYNAETKELLKKYSSIRESARLEKTAQTTISNCIKTGELFRNKYILTDKLLEISPN